MAIPIADAGSDQTFTFDQLPLTANLSGSGTDPDAGAITGYLWELIEKPTGSSAALSSTTAQNPDLLNVDTPGTYLVFLIVTDDQAEDSDDNPLSAPTSARVHINVGTENADLVKPAPGEYDWHPKYWDLVDVVDTLQGDLDALGPASARGEFTAQVIGTHLAQGFNPLIVDVPQPAGSESLAAVAFRVASNIYVDSFSFQLADAGGLGSRWTVSLYDATVAEYEANTYGGGNQLGTVTTAASTVDHGPEAHEVVLGAPAAVDAGQVLALLVENAPLQNIPAKDPGTGMSVSIVWRHRG